MTFSNRFVKITCLSPYYLSEIETDVRFKDCTKIIQVGSSQVADLETRLAGNPSGISENAYNSFDYSAAGYSS